MWCIATKKIGRVAVKEQGKSEYLLFNRSLNWKDQFLCIEKSKYAIVLAALVGVGGIDFWDGYLG
jgi:hypothetical protein